MEEVTERNAATTLDEARDGGQRILFLCFERLDAIRSSLQEGRFTDAAQIASELEGYTGSLSHAEQYMARFARLTLVRAAELEVGMLIDGFGVATEVDINVHDCTAGDEPHVVAAVKFESGGERKFDGKAQLLVKPER